MARALIVGCGCRGRELGRILQDDGWQVRGTTRGSDSMAAIAAAGIEPALADPARPATVFEQIADVTVVIWALGAATGPPRELAAIHGARLERLLEQLVDTPVRGFVYDATGGDPRMVAGGERVVREAGERWRIPAEVLGGEPAPDEWAGAAAAAVLRLVAAP